MSFAGKLKAFWMRLLSPATHRLEDLSARLSVSEQRLTHLQEALGRIENRQLEGSRSFSLQEHEYRVFSQWGEDGIIQFLLKHIPVEPKVFVEFGVEDYREANTRFLLINDHWTGLVMDGSSENINRLKMNQIYWAYGLKAVQAFVTKENINRLLEENGIGGEIGLLSIDIDGNDYWVWSAIDTINPAIVIVEYNYRFGPEVAVTIPYDEKFERGKLHPVIYFGASLRALCLLAKRKGYAFVGCNSNGVNAFFVRRDKLPVGLRELSPAEGYVAGKFSESRDESGQFLHVSHEEEKLQVMSLPLVDVEGFK